MIRETGVWVGGNGTDASSLPLISGHKHTLVHTMSPVHTLLCHSCSLASFPPSLHPLFCQSARAAACADLQAEVSGCWCDILPEVLAEEWRACRRGGRAGEVGEHQICVMQWYAVP